jgi:hypothetical protein
MLSNLDDPIVTDEPAIHHSLDAPEIDIKQITFAEPHTGIDFGKELRVFDRRIERREAVVDAPLVAILEGHNGVAAAVPAQREAVYAEGKGAHAVGRIKAVCLK